MALVAITYTISGTVIMSRAVGRSLLETISRGRTTPRILGDIHTVVAAVEACLEVEMATQGLTIVKATQRFTTE